MALKQIIFLVMIGIITYCKANFINFPDNILNDQVMDINQSVHYGAHCNPYLDEPCFQWNNTCKFSITQNATICLEPTKIGDPCENYFDCLDINNVMCNKHRECQCMNDYIGLNNECAPLVSSSCDKSKDCAVENSICVNNKCTCKPSFVSHFKDHCKPTRLGERCWTDYDCGDVIHMKCSEDKKCSCKPNRIVKNNATCASPLGGFCENNDACAITNSICRSNICQCRKNFESLSSKICVTRTLDRHCVTDFDCSDTLHMECSEIGKCTCRSNHILKNDTACLPLLGAFCLDDKGCTVQNSECFNNKCQCKTNYKTISNDKCVITKFGEFCMDLLDCKDILHLKCSEYFRCSCKDNHVLINNYTCAPLLNEYCWLHESCAVQNSFCENYNCRCKPDYEQKSNNRCIPTKLGLACESNEDCEELHAVCSAGVCACRKNNIIHNNNKCLPVIGGYCDEQNSCNPKNSKCTNNICQYKEGHV